MVGGAASRRPQGWSFRFDPASKAWHRIAGMKPRSEVAAAGLDGKRYVIGWIGEDHRLLNRVDVFDPTTGAWQDPRCACPPRS